MTGFLLINKPPGPTSHDIVDKIRQISGEKRVGHSGTLDPFASGVLLMGVGREATREFPKLTGLDKRYQAVLRLGAMSDTDDRTGKITNIRPSPGYATLPLGQGGGIQGEGLKKILQRFTGKIEQIPPMYSAKKIGGKKLYELARQGLHVARGPSHVEIFSIDIVEYFPLDTPHSITIEVHCSSGTYIRSLARDIGAELGCGAYLEELERTAVGPFRIEETVRIDDLNAANVEKYIFSTEKILARCQRG